MTSPEERTLDVLTVGVESAFGDGLHLLLVKKARVSAALAMLYGGHFVSGIAAEGSQHGARAVEVRAEVLHVGARAVNPLALVDRVGVAVGVVEAAEPHGASVSGQGPLTEPDRILDQISVGSVLLVVITVLFRSRHALVPRLIIVMVHDDIVDVVVIEQIVPRSAHVKRIEDELLGGLMLAENVTHASIEVLEHG